jgi:hypothetical protein
MKKLLALSFVFSYSLYADDMKSIEKSLTYVSKAIDQIHAIHDGVMEKIKPFDQKRSLKESEVIEKEIARIIRGFELKFSFFSEFFNGEGCQSLKDHPFVWYFSALQDSNSKLTSLIRRCKKHVKTLTIKLGKKKITDADKTRYERFLKQVNNAIEESTNLIIELSYVEKFIKLTDSYVREKQSFRTSEKLSSLGSSTFLIISN